MNKNKRVLKNDMKPGVIKYVNEDTNEIKKFILILLGVAAISVVLFFVTAKYLVKDAYQDNKKSDVTDTISYNMVDAGSVFNRPYDEYYVLAYDTESTDAIYYSSNASSFGAKNKVYTMDLSVEVNKKYIKESGNSKAKNPSELSIVNPTLIHIKNGNIVNYYEGKEKIGSILK